MQQTSINQYFRTTKRPAAESISRKVAIKYVAKDESSPRPVSSPTRQAVHRKEEGISHASSLIKDVPSSIKTDEGFSTPKTSPTTKKHLWKELNLGEFRKVICRSKRLYNLKTSLDKVNATTSRLKTIEKSINDFNQSPDIKKKESLEFEIHTSPAKCGALKPRQLFNPESSCSRKDQSYVSPRKLLDEGPAKSPVKPVYDRYQHLLAEGRDLLPLPSKYEILRELFNSVETVVRMMAVRGETATFNIIRGDVQRMTRRNFTADHLYMIRTLYPAAFSLKFERMKLPLCGEETLEIVITKRNIKEINLTESKKIFENLLRERTKLHHQKFLLTLNPPLNVSLDQIRRWHPSFDLDNIPDIELSPIEKPPGSSNEETMSAKDLLEKTREIMSCNKQMERAVSQLVEGTVKQKTNIDDQPSNPSKPISSPAAFRIAALEKALKGIPKSVLEKIRARNAAKMVQTITRTSDEVRQSVMISRLPELARIMRIIFVNEKKGVLPEDLVMTKLEHSYKEKMLRNGLIEHVKLISKHVPGWLNFCTVRNISYIRLSKDADISRIIGKLQKLADTEY